MFWIRNKENKFPIHTLIWRPGEILQSPQHLHLHWCWLKFLKGYILNIKIKQDHPCLDVRYWAITVKFYAAPLWPPSIKVKDLEIKCFLLRFLNTKILSFELIHISVFVLIHISDTGLKHQSALSRLSSWPWAQGHGIRKLILSTVEVFKETFTECGWELSQCS